MLKVYHLTIKQLSTYQLQGTQKSREQRASEQLEKSPIHQTRKLTP